MGRSESKVIFKKKAAIRNLKMHTNDFIDDNAMWVYAQRSKKGKGTDVAGLIH